MRILPVLFILKIVYSAPSNEFNRFVESDADLAIDDVPFSTTMEIVPSGNVGQKTHKRYKVNLEDLIDTDTETYKNLHKFIEKGYMMKGLTFTLYNDNMREATVALFRLFQKLDQETFYKVVEWAKHNINDDMLEYAWRLVPIFTEKFNHKQLSPRFITKPNYFVNGETIIKAFRLKLANGDFNRHEAKVNQFYRTDDIITINTNYSNWNLKKKRGVQNIDYFREDVGLNNYYYGLHLLYPFWMSNDEIDELHPGSILNYYYAHQQLLTRYRLEHEHLKVNKNGENVNKFDDGYNSYLQYDNGLLFPYRRKMVEDENDEVRVYITKTIIGIRESIARNFIIIDHGSKKVNTSMSEEILAKLIRTNIDGIKSAKIIRSYYGSNGYPIDEYSPAPSVFHHTETSLRDPLYWHLITCMLKYFLEYKKKVGSFDLSEYETDSVQIIEAQIPKITTYFDYYEFDITGALGDKNNFMKSSITYTARQRRLSHSPFKLNFTIESKVSAAVVIRLFLGPQCNGFECFEMYPKFFKLGQFQYELKEEENYISWSPKDSKQFSSDEIYNLHFTNASVDATTMEYNMYKFPERLLIPKGHRDGLNLTLFIIVTPLENNLNKNAVPPLRKGFLGDNYLEIDDKPLGFPFHRSVENYNHNAYNYKFYNISIFHEEFKVDGSGVFSSHLY